jgi:hypothetical protein
MVLCLVIPADGDYTATAEKNIQELEFLMLLDMVFTGEETPGTRGTPAQKNVRHQVVSLPSVLDRASGVSHLLGRRAAACCLLPAHPTVGYKCVMEISQMCTKYIYPYVLSHLLSTSTSSSPPPFLHNANLTRDLSAYESCILWAGLKWDESHVRTPDIYHLPCLCICSMSIIASTISLRSRLITFRQLRFRMYVAGITWR